MAIAVVGLVVTGAVAIPMAPDALATEPSPAVTPTSGYEFDVDVTGLHARLEKAAAEEVSLAGRNSATGETGDRGVVVRLADPDGVSVVARVLRSPVMPASLAADHPDVLAFRGSVIGDPSRSVFLDIGPLGLHAAVRGGDEPGFYIDPLNRPTVGDASAMERPGAEEHLSYRSGTLEENSDPLVEFPGSLPEALPEGLGDEGSELAASPPNQSRLAQVPDGAGQLVETRVYRLAMVTDPSFAAFYGGTSDAVTQAKVAIVERVNQIYISDLGAELELAEGSDDLDLLTDGDAYEASGRCGPTPCFDAADTETCYNSSLSRDALRRTAFVTGTIVGADKFDIGHIVLGKLGGGVAGHGVAGGASKSAGCTGSTAPVGDGFAVDYVAHEIGHQLSASHTFDGCGGQGTNDSGVEPGSGSTVMAYAGICGDDNLQANSDPFMSAYTMSEIGGFMSAELAARLDEWQTLSLSGFDDDGDSVTLTYPGADTVTLTRGENFTVAGVKAALAELTGWTPVVFDLDRIVEESMGEEGVEDRGFGFSFVNQGEGKGVDLDRVQVVSTSQGVVARIGVIVDGGPQENGGYRTVASGNHHPVVTAPADVTIPVRTPFVLTGTGTDPDGDALGYGWEQIDDGAAIEPATQPLRSDSRSDGPLFRVFGKAVSIDPLTSPAAGQASLESEPTRTFPDLEQIAAGHTNAATGGCGDQGDATVDCYSEFLPTSAYARTVGRMHFQLTARDFDPFAGGRAADQVTVNIDPDAGPLRVTAAPTGTVASSTSSVVRWDVNDTDQLASQVRLTLSLDGGQTYPVDLTGPTPNDGAVEVTWPRQATSTARVRVEAVDNIFFAINDQDFTLIDAGPIDDPDPTTPDTTAPRLSVSRGPADGAIVTNRRTRYAFVSDDATAKLTCTVDAVRVSCPGGVVNLVAPSPGKHVLRARAVDPAGNAAAVSRRLIVPLDDTDLRRRGMWHPINRAAAYRGTVLRSTVSGATLTTRVTNPARLILIADTSPHSGALAVFVDKRRMGKVSLGGTRANRSHRIKLPIAELQGTHRIRLVTIGARPVVIDGLAIVPG